MNAETRGRPRSFDPNLALDKALTVFLLKGFDATSLDDLTKAMGINRPSLYAAFGSKSDLYQAALRLYAERGVEQMLAVMTSASDIVEGLKALVRGYADRMASSAEGCLLVSSVSQCGREDEKMIEAKTRLLVGDVSSRLKDCLAAAKAKGQLAEHADPQALAYYVAGFAQGLVSFGRTSGNPEAVRQMADVACGFFDSLKTP